MKLLDKELLERNIDEIAKYDTENHNVFGSSYFWIDSENDICAVFMKNSRFDGGAGNQSACRFEKAVHDSMKGC